MLLQATSISDECVRVRYAPVDNPGSYGLTDPWRHGLERLREIRGLRPNWDYEGADAPNRWAVESAMDLLKQFRDAGDHVPPDRITVAPDGTIVGRKLLESSGNTSWDQAVLRAIDRTEVIPRDTDGRVVPQFPIEFRPKS